MRPGTIAFGFLGLMSLVSCGKRQVSDRYIVQNEAHQKTLEEDTKDLDALSWVIKYAVGGVTDLGIEFKTPKNSEIESLKVMPEVNLLTDLSSFQKLKYLSLSNSKIQNLKPTEGLQSLDGMFIDGSQVDSDNLALYLASHPDSFVVTDSTQHKKFVIEEKFELLEIERGNFCDELRLQAYLNGVIDKKDLRHWDKYNDVPVYRQGIDPKSGLAAVAPCKVYDAQK